MCSRAALGAKGAFILVTLLGSIHQLELLEVGRLLSQLRLEFFECLHLLRSDDEFLFVFIRTSLRFFLLLFVHEMLAFLLIFLIPHESNLAQRQVILEPLVLVLIVDEVGQELPVAWGIRCSFYHIVIPVIAKVWHRGHANYRVFNMLQFLESEGVRGYWYLGVTDFHDGGLVGADQFNGVLIVLCNSNELLSIFRAQIFILIILSDLVK